MRRLLIGLALIAPMVARAQFTITYKGTEHFGDKEIPATTQYSVEDGRVVAVIRGAKTARMIYLAKDKVLRVINEDDKSYTDLDQGTVDQMTSMVADMQKQLEQVPAAQRAMVEGMMKRSMGGTKPPLKYVWSNETQKVAGYECRVASGMRGDDKVTDYCASTSPDFKVSAAERKTMLDMQAFLHSFTSIIRTNEENSTKAFEWDSKGEGYPVQTRCYRDGKVTLDLLLDKVSHERLADSLFVVPEGYKKMEMPKMERPRR